MPFWDRAAKTAKDAADKAAFEGNKLVHIQREQGALNDLRGKAQARLCDLGRLALSLYQNGTLTDPSAAALAQEVADLEAQVNAQQAKIEGIKAEQYGSAPVAAYAPPASYSPAPTYGAPAQPSAPPPEPWSAAPPPPAPFDAAPPPPAPTFGPANVAPPPAPFNAAPPPPVTADVTPPATVDAELPPPAFGPANVAPPPAPTDVPLAQSAATVECPNCHTQVRPDAAFCPECGTRLRS